MENTVATSPEGGLNEEQYRIWETNHKKILDAITEATKYFGSHLPTITEIARLTGLSRLTVYKHFKDFSTHPANLQRAEMFEAMQTEILIEICRKAMVGNLPAAKLYLELTGKIKSKAQPEDLQANTYVQINGTVLNQQIIQSLSSEQLKKIEDIIKSNVVVQEPVLSKISEQVVG